MRTAKHNLEKRMRKAEAHEISQSNLKKNISDEPAILNAIANYLKIKGVLNIKLKELYEYVKKELPLECTAPSISTLNRIVKQKFFLKFKRMKTTTAKYYESTYAEKRLWVSRLLTQFLHDGAVIVSVDESNFKSELEKDWCW